MLIIRNLKLSLSTDFESLEKTVLAKLKLKEGELSNVKLYKKSVDCRDENNIFFSCSVTAECKNEAEFIKKYKRIKAEIFKEEKYLFPPKREYKNIKRPVVVGFGPAGIFTAYLLSLAGLNPIVIEQGEDVDSRTKRVEQFFSDNRLNELSNVQFGEGGAGTFSDGKLNTGIKDVRCKAVLQTFVNFGAQKEILYEAKPHIGTDVLKKVVKNIREEIIKNGGEVLFCHKLIDIGVKNGKIENVTVRSGDKEFDIECSELVLATGHSSRDTFGLCKEKGFSMSPKPFAMGVRIEHKQEDINKAQYKSFAGHKALRSADYKLALHLKNGRGVFTFCMCPGGYVVNASSEEGGVVTNGMSYSGRGGENANSALLVGVAVKDYYKGDVLDGVYLQREIEQKAYKVGGGLPVCQMVGDFLKGIPSTKCGSVAPTVKPQVSFGSIEDILPEFITSSIKEALPLLDKKLKGFAEKDALLTGPETRSSSPVRIERNGQFEASVQGLFPCGEGAGYAGGIMSAAVDGMKVAEQIIKLKSVN